ncbi:hypothetical protein V6N13_039859 [Hibiscus sabdariffa]
MGRFTVRSPYFWMMGHVAISGSNASTKVWKLSVPKRVCSFYWVAMRGGLLTNVERYLRHMRMRVFIYADIVMRICCMCFRTAIVPKRYGSS